MPISSPPSYYHAPITHSKLSHEVPHLNLFKGKDLDLRFCFEVLPTVLDHVMPDLCP
jgi:hypothetical protein